MASQSGAGAAAGLLAAAWIEAHAVTERQERQRTKMVEVAFTQVVEYAGDELAKLQALFEAEVGVIHRRDATAQLLNFVDADLTDAFRGFTHHAAGLLLSNDGSRSADALIEIEGYLDLVVRYLSIARLAARHPMVEEHCRTVFEGVGDALHWWGRVVAHLIAALAEQ